MSPEPVEITVDGQTIRGLLHIPSNSPKALALLFLHGWTGKSNDQAAAVMAQHGFYAMTINMRGHNTSDGDIKKVSARDSLADAKTAYDFLQEHLPPGAGVCAVGNSYGGYIAALLSAERPLACLSLRVAANYQDDTFTQPKWGNGADNPQVMAWRNQPLDFSENRALRAVHEFKGPIQIIEAEHDDRVPGQTLKNYANAAANKKQLDYHLMKGWPHSLADDKTRNKEFQALLLEWAEKQV